MDASRGYARCVQAVCRAAFGTIRRSARARRRRRRLSALAAEILAAVDALEVVRALPGVEDVETELTWDPPWTPEKMSDDAKFILGFG